MTKLESFLYAWADSLASLLSQVSGDTWDPRWVNEDGANAIEQRFAVRVSGGITGELHLLFGSADASHLLEVFLGEKADDAQTPEVLQESVLELLRQWAGLASTHLKRIFGETSLQLAVDDAEALSPGPCKVLRVADGEKTIQVGLQLCPELMRCFDRRADRHDRREEDARRIEALLQGRNLDLLMDVELGVMLRFGSRRAALREVLELSAGVVLELDREIHEPVDLLLNDRVIARGEVVVVDGNYGLRITALASREQRLGTL